MNQRTFTQRVRQMLAPVFVAIMAGFKWILPALKFGLPFLKTFGTMAISIFFYARIWGWQFGVGFVLLIFVHECGHLIAARVMGLKVGWPVFIPFMGALIALKEAPRNAWIEAVVGAGGPLLGGIGALAVGGLYFMTGNQLFLVLGYTGLFLNVFNLVPIVPLDGGRIVSAISPWLWLIGLVIIVPFLLWQMSGSGILILIIVAMSLPRVIRLFRGKTPETARYYECTARQRWTMALLYFGLLAGLGGSMGFLHKILVTFME